MKETHSIHQLHKNHTEAGTRQRTTNAIDINKQS